MSDLYIRKASAIGRRVDDVPHRLAVVFLGQAPPEPPRPDVILTAGWAVALVAVETGKVLVWDGWYSADLEEQGLPLDVFDDVDREEWDNWDGWDNAPSLLVVERMRPWLAGPVAEWLAPTFSPAREAASMFAAHFDSLDDSDTWRQLRDAAVVAYVPLLDEDVLVAEVDRLEGRLTRSDGQIARALSAALRALDNEEERELD